MFINNVAQIGLTGTINKNQNSLYKVLEKLSTAKNINSASDDAAGLAIAEKLLSQVRGFKSAETNTDYASAAMAIGEGASNEVSAMLQRQRELAMQASNDTQTPENRKALNDEYQALSKEIDRVSNSSQFNTQGTANGSGVASGNAQVLTGANAGDVRTLPKADFRTASIGTSATDISTGVNARNAINKIDSAIKNVSSQRSNLGASMNVMEHTRNNLVNQENNTQQAESLIRDMDMAVGVAELARTKILSQSSIASLGNFNQISSQNMMALLQ